MDKKAKHLKLNRKMGKRIKELEAIVIEKNHTIQDMYDTDMEISWSKKANELQSNYEKEYGVSLEYEDD
jgi:hypothetical protein